MTTPNENALMAALYWLLKDEPGRVLKIPVEEIVNKPMPFQVMRQDDAEGQFLLVRLDPEAMKSKIN